MTPSQASSQTQPEVQDMQQRVRVGTDTLFKDLVMAGAGPYQGSLTGALNQYFAAILPRKTGYSSPDPSTSAFSDRITTTYVPNTYTQTTISSSMPPQSAELKVNFDATQAGCPNDGACGFVEGDEVLIFDRSGHFDTFTITHVQESANHLQHRGQDLSYEYQPGAVILKVKAYSYYLDTTAHQLMRYDGGDDVPTPVVDNVVALQFDYYGDPDTTWLPKPPAGQTSCVYPDGTTLVTGLYSAPSSTVDGSMAKFPLSAFTDGPWCGSGSNAFDADLLRIRKLKMTIRVQTPLAALRGQDRNLFRIPGTSRSGQQMVPDLTAALEVSPRNMNLSR